MQTREFTRNMHECSVAEIYFDGKPSGVRIKDRNGSPADYMLVHKRELWQESIPRNRTPTNLTLALYAVFWALAGAATVNFFATPEKTSQTPPPVCSCEK